MGDAEVVGTSEAHSGETPDLFGAFPRLTHDQIAVLATKGHRRAVQRSEILYREGDRRCDFLVILAGLVAVVEGYGRDEQVLGVHGPRRFLGELSLVAGQPLFVTAIAREPGEVLAVPMNRLADVVAKDDELGNLILHAYLIRRSRLLSMGAGLRIVGSRFSPDSRRLLEFLARNRIPHRWVDLESDQEAEAILRELGIDPRDTPVVLWRGEALRNPSNADLARILGLRVPTSAHSVFDVLVVGAGPAGLAASVYGASEGLRIMALDGVAMGGQAGASPRIENYLGFPSGISGAELAERAAVQAEKFGARVNIPAQAASIERRDGHYQVRLEDGDAIESHVVVIASGVRYRKLPVPRLEEFEGSSIFYAATQLEAHLCHNAPVAVVGGGNSAGQAAVFLARRTPRVRLVIRDGDLGKSMSRYLVDRIERNPKIDVMRHTEVRELVGEGALEAVVVEDNLTGDRETVDARALFVFIGAEPHTRWLGDLVAMDEKGFVLTGPAAVGPAQGGPQWGASRDPFLLETSSPGVFAVGDVRRGSIKRVAAAVGEGSMAIRLCHDYLEAGPAPVARLDT